MAAVCYVLLQRDGSIAVASYPEKEPRLRLRLVPATLSRSGGDLGEGEMLVEYRHSAGDDDLVDTIEAVDVASGLGHEPRQHYRENINGEVVGEFVFDPPLTPVGREVRVRVAWERLGQLPA